MLTKNLALISQSSKVKADKLQEVAAAIQKQVTRDLAPIWNISATISVFSSLRSLPVGYWPIIIKDDINQPGAGGFHSKKNNQPFALIKASDDDEWILSTSHETIEMLIDPSGNTTVAGDSLKQGQGRVLYLLEACDPSEAGEFAYSINGITVSDFITPHYHDPVASPSVRYSFTGSITAPRQVLKGGYISWFEPETQSIWQAINVGQGLQFRELGVSPSGFSLRQFVDSHPDNIVEPYSKTLPSNKIKGNTEYETREKSSIAASRIWEEDINSYK